jgi:hypothetical protein
MTTEDTNAEGTGGTQPEKTKRASIDILSEVAEKIGQSTPQVRERVIDSLVEREVAARTDILDKALAKRTELDREIRKLQKPDVEQFDHEGKVMSASFSKARVDELKKAREGLEKLEKAIDKAITDNDFSKVKEIVGK